MGSFPILLGRILPPAGPSKWRLALARRFATATRHQVAFRLFAKLAKAGVPEACYEVGRSYLIGRGVPCSLSAALRWLRRAADADVVAAQTALASLALQGIHETNKADVFEQTYYNPVGEPDYRTALFWARRATERASPEAEAIAGYVLTEGPTELRDPDLGEQLYCRSARAGAPSGQLGWALTLLRRGDYRAAAETYNCLERAASSGLPAAWYVLGVIAESGLWTERDLAAAARHYHTAAEAGHRSAQLRYGIALLTGRGVAIDRFHGESWLRRAALAGETRAAAILGDLHASGTGVSLNHIEAELWLRRAAEGGNVGSAKALARLLLAGGEPTPDSHEALQWLRQATAAGDLESRDVLARLALVRQVPESDSTATYRWFREQAEAGDPRAAFNLGLCLREGIGVARNDAQALKWLEQAASSLPVALYWCGRMRAEGRGCAADARAARLAFLRAAWKHNADAEVAAAEMLINGRGGRCNRSLAMILLRRAAANGHSGAKFALRTLGHPAATGPQTASASLSTCRSA